MVCSKDAVFGSRVKIDAKYIGFPCALVQCLSFQKIRNCLRPLQHAAQIARKFKKKIKGVGVVTDPFFLFEVAHANRIRMHATVNRCILLG